VVWSVSNRERDVHHPSHWSSHIAMALFAFAFLRTLAPTFAPSRSRHLFAPSRSCHPVRVLVRALPFVPSHPVRILVRAPCSRHPVRVLVCAIPFAPSRSSPRSRHPVQVLVRALPSAPSRSRLPVHAFPFTPSRSRARPRPLVCALVCAFSFTRSFASSRLHPRLCPPVCICIGCLKLLVLYCKSSEYESHTSMFYSF
jgi:hypothetical protein